MRDDVGKRAVLFDMDGVLVLTNRLKAKAHVATVREFGGNADLDLYKQVVGQSHSVVRSVFIQASQVNIEPGKYTQTYRRIYRELLQTQLEAAPGISSLLHKLWEYDFLLAVVSSSDITAVNMILEKTGFDTYFAVRVASNDVSRKKPAPDAYLIALEKLGVTADNAVVLEDSKAGIEAARAAGMPVIAVYHALNTNQDFSGANFVIDSFRDSETVFQMVYTLLDASH